MKSIEFRTNPMFLRNQFKGEGVFEIPQLKIDEIDLEEIELIGYDKLCENETEAIVHFFMDDYKFEVMWKDSEPRIEKLKKYKAVLSPDFSMYTEMPLSVKVYNTFRSRWCGAYMQAKGVKVIPTVSWRETNTFWFCFDGIPKGSIVAVSTIGVRKEKSLFMLGYEEMMRKIKPKAVICYGESFEEMNGKIITVDYAETNHYTKHFGGKVDSVSCAQGLGENKFIKMAYGYVDGIEKGRGSANNGSNQNSGSMSTQTVPLKQCRLSELPDNVKNSYSNYNRVAWKGNYEGQTTGTKAGSKWNNNPPQLPQTDSKGETIMYHEFDVNNKVQGALRDGERFVRGSDGRTYYTPDHYNTFQEIID